LPPYISPLPESITVEELEYLHTNGALTMPGTPLRDHLLRAFVEYVYPFLPLLDLEELLSIVLDGDGLHGQVSLLVFQTIMLAGSGFVDMPFLKAAGFRREEAHVVHCSAKQRFGLSHRTQSGANSRKASL